MLVSSVASLGKVTAIENSTKWFDLVRHRPIFRSGCTRLVFDAHKGESLAPGGSARLSRRPVGEREGLAA
jgi:hypothetical protein